MTEPTDDRIEILVKPHGSIAVRGPVVVRDPDGNEIPRPTGKHPGITKFCGCGRSKNKPFCDGSHREEQKTETGNQKPEVRTQKPGSSEQNTG